MSNIKKQSSSFQQITGVQDISHESAAACSGGTIILYDDYNRKSGKGTKSYTFGSVNTLLDFNNRASSFEVTAGNTWRVYRDQNRSTFNSSTYTNPSVVLGGFFGQSGNFGFVGFSNFDNNVESLEKI